MKTAHVKLNRLVLHYIGMVGLCFNAYGGCHYALDWWGMHNGESYALQSDLSTLHTADLTLPCGDSLILYCTITEDCGWPWHSLTRNGVELAPPYFTITQPGFYDLNVHSDIFDLHFLWNLTFSDCDEVGISEPATGIGSFIALWPSPVGRDRQEQVQVRVQFANVPMIDGPLFVGVIGLDGRSIDQFQVPLSQIHSTRSVVNTGNELQFSVDLNGLSPGPYGIQISDGHSWRVTQKIVME